MTVPASVTEIGGGALEGTSFYETLKDNDGFYVLNKILLGYKGDNKVTEIVTPQNVEKIRSECNWENTDSLKRLTISEGVKNIGYKSLKVGSLDELTIPASVDTIGMEALPVSIGKLYFNAYNANFVGKGCDLNELYSVTHNFFC